MAKKYMYQHSNTNILVPLQNAIHQHKEKKIEKTSKKIWKTTVKISTFASANAKISSLKTLESVNKNK